MNLTMQEDDPRPYLTPIPSMAWCRVLHAKPYSCCALTVDLLVKGVCTHHLNQCISGNESAHCGEPHRKLY